MFDVLAPAGTPKATPVELPTAFLPGDLVGIELNIPDGHNGLTGIQIAVAHSPVIPRTAGAWIVGNDEHLTLDTIGYPSSGAWSAFVYNTDLFDHTFHLRYLVADFAYTQPAPAVAAIAPPRIV